MTGISKKAVPYGVCSNIERLSEVAAKDLCFKILFDDTVMTFMELAFLGFPYNKQRNARVLLVVLLDI
jgi:hypothetical protein